MSLTQLVGRLNNMCELQTKGYLIKKNKKNKKINTFYILEEIFQYEINIIGNKIKI